MRYCPSQVGLPRSDAVTGYHALFPRPGLPQRRRQLLEVVFFHAARAVRSLGMICAAVTVAGDSKNRVLRCIASSCHSFMASMVMASRLAGVAEKGWLR